MKDWTHVRRLVAALAVVALLALCYSSHALAQRQTEDRAKVIAAFLYKFISFVDWPESAFASPTDTFRIVVLHDDDVEAAVIDSVAGKEVKGRTIEVHTSAAEDALANCHMLFVGDTSEGRVRDALEKLDGRPVLTVGLSERFARRGGIIRLFESDRRLNIEVNLIAAKRVNLEISSKLLAVAKVLREADLNTQAELEDSAEHTEPADSEKVD